jgi:hypothetical protein
MRTETFYELKVEPIAGCGSYREFFLQLPTKEQVLTRLREDIEATDEDAPREMLEAAHEIVNQLGVPTTPGESNAYFAGVYVGCFRLTPHQIVRNDQ